jgi:hypothetical protein
MTTFGIMQSCLSILLRLLKPYGIPVLILASIASAHEGYTQKITGFYFTVECSRYTGKPKPVTLGLGKLQVCTTAQPVVSIDEFEAIGELFEIPEQNFAFFDVTLSNEAHEALKKVGATFSFNDLAFVMDDEVVFLFAIETNNPTRIFRITDSSHSRDLKRIHAKLKSLSVKE